MTNSHIGERFDVSTAYGTLTIGGVQLVDHGAWSILDLAPLWGHPDVKGDDGVMPRASGRRPFPRRANGVIHQLRFVCTGWRTITGELTPYPGTTPEAQLETNMAYLWDNVFEPVGSGTGTRAAVWTTPGGNTVSADVRARLPAAGLALLPRGALRATLELEDPRSELHL